MRDHDELFERIKSKTQQYEMDKRKRSNRLQIAIAAFAFVALIGVTIAAYNKLGKGRATPAGNGTPTNSVAASTPTESVNLTDPVTSPTPVDKKGTPFTLLGDTSNIGKDDVPGAGQVVIGSKSLDEALKLVSDDDYLAIRIVFNLEDNEVFREFEQSFDEKYTKDPMFVKYNEDFDKWEKEVYAPTHTENDGTVTGNPVEEFEKIWKASHTEEEWQHLKEVEDCIVRGNEFFREFIKPYDESEIARIRATGVNIVKTSYGVIALMTKSQVEGFQASEDYSYTLQWANTDLNGTPGFTGVDTSSLTWMTVTAVGEYDGCRVYDLYGEPAPAADEIKE